MGFRMSSCMVYSIFSRFLWSLLRRYRAKSAASNSGRISMSESTSIGLGQRLSHSTASSRDLTCQSQYPEICSSVGVKGPLTTVRWAPEKRTRLPSEVGFRPPPPCMIPALISSSLYRSEEHTSELQSLRHLVCRLLLE